MAVVMTLVIVVILEPTTAQSNGCEGEAQHIPRMLEP
jgi:hypothetical protein